MVRTAAAVTWDQVRAWRTRRQHLGPVDGGAALDVVRRLCGVQAQLSSAAALTVAVRQRRPDRGATAAALADRTLVRTWAMRGTLHLLPVDEAGAYLSLLGSAQTWLKGAWQKEFVTEKEMAALESAVRDALADGAELTRDELVAAVVRHSGDAALGEHVRSGWGAVLKPLSYQGLLCQGTVQGNRVTFVRPEAWSPGWSGIPEPDDAARLVIPRYLSAFGPVTQQTFGDWLIRGAMPRARMRAWFEDLGDELATVDVEGTTAHLRAEDLDDLAGSKPHRAVRLLPAFDQYVLGPGTKDAASVPPEHRGLVSRAAGWISPVVLVGGRAAGTWSSEGGGVAVEPFPGNEIPAAALAAEISRLAGLL